MDSLNDQYFENLLQIKENLFEEFTTPESEQELDPYPDCSNLNTPQPAYSYQTNSPNICQNNSGTSVNITSFDCQSEKDESNLISLEQVIEESGIEELPISSPYSSEVVDLTRPSSIVMENEIEHKEEFEQKEIPCLAREVSPESINVEKLSRQLTPSPHQSKSLEISDEFSTLFQRFGEEKPEEFSWSSSSPRIPIAKPVALQTMPIPLSMQVQSPMAMAVATSWSPLMYPFPTQATVAAQSSAYNLTMLRAYSSYSPYLTVSMPTYPQYVSPYATAPVLVTIPPQNPGYGHCHAPTPNCTCISNNSDTVSLGINCCTCVRAAQQFQIPIPSSHASLFQYNHQLPDPNQMIQNETVMQRGIGNVAATAATLSTSEQRRGNKLCSFTNDRRHICNSYATIKLENKSSRVLTAPVCNTNTASASCSSTRDQDERKDNTSSTSSSSSSDSETEVVADTSDDGNEAEEEINVVD